MSFVRVKCVFGVFFLALTSRKRRERTATTLWMSTEEEESQTSANDDMPYVQRSVCLRGAMSEPVGGGFFVMRVRGG